MKSLPYGWSIHQLNQTSIMQVKKKVARRNYELMQQKMQNVLNEEIPNYVRVNKGDLFYVNKGSFCLITLDKIKANPSTYLHKIIDNNSQRERILFAIRNQNPAFDEPSLFPIFSATKNILVVPLTNDQITEVIKDAEQRKKSGRFEKKLTKALCYVFGKYSNSTLPRLISGTETAITDRWCKKHHYDFFQPEFKVYEQLLQEEAHQIGETFIKFKTQQNNESKEQTTSN